MWFEKIKVAVLKGPWSANHISSTRIRWFNLCLFIILGKFKQKNVIQITYFSRHLKKVAVLKALVRECGPWSANHIGSTRIPIIFVRIWKFNNILFVHCTFSSSLKNSNKNLVRSCFVYRTIYFAFQTTLSIVGEGALCDEPKVSNNSCERHYLHVPDTTCTRTTFAQSNPDNSNPR